MDEEKKQRLVNLATVYLVWLIMLFITVLAAALGYRLFIWVIG